MTMDIHALVGAYVLDAVDDIERAAFDRHLDTCRACAAEVEELRETTARLADSTWSVPPPRLRREVMARIAVTRQVGPRHSAAPARSRPVWGRRLLAAAAAVVLAAGAGTAVYAYQEQRLRDERIAAQAARAEADRIQAVLTAPDASLRTAEVEGGGHVTVVVSKSRDAGVMMLVEGAAPPAGRAYQLWLISGAVPAPDAVMLPQTGSGTMLFSSVRKTDAVALTIEPAGGSQTPTAPVKVRVPLDL